MNRFPYFGISAEALVAERTRQLVLQSRAAIASTRLYADLTRDRLRESLQRLEALKQERD